MRFMLMPSIILLNNKNTIFTHFHLGHFGTIPINFIENYLAHINYKVWLQEKQLTNCNNQTSDTYGYAINQQVYLPGNSRP
jgi:hypothetical protein